MPPLYQFNVMEVEMQGGVTFPSQVFLGRGGEEGGRVVGEGVREGGIGEDEEDEEEFCVTLCF